MASPVAHTLAAYSTLILLEPPLYRKPRLAIGAAFVFGNLADADFVVAHFTRITYLQHHYFSHSIPFAICIGLVTYLILKLTGNSTPMKLSLLFTALYGTHLLIDYFTDDGSPPYGIPLLWPFTTHHFLSPVMIFYATHRGGWSELLSRHNLTAGLIELAVFLPLAFISVKRAKAAL